MTEGPSELARRIAEAIHPEVHHGEYGAHEPLKCSPCATYFVARREISARMPIPAETLDQAIEAMHAAMLELLQSSDRRHFEVATQLRVALDALRAAKSEGGPSK